MNWHYTYAVETKTLTDCSMGFRQIVVVHRPFLPDPPVSDRWGRTGSAGVDGELGIDGWGDQLAIGAASGIILA